MPALALGLPPLQAESWGATNMEETAEALLNPLDIGAERPELLPTDEAHDVLCAGVNLLPTCVADVDDARVAHLSVLPTPGPNVTGAPNGASQAEAAPPRAVAAGVHGGGGSTAPFSTVRRESSDRVGAANAFGSLTCGFARAARMV